MKEPGALDTSGSKRRKGGHMGVRVLFLACVMDDNFDDSRTASTLEGVFSRVNNNEMVR